METTKKRSKFLPALLIYLSLGFAIIGAVLLLVWQYAKQYEQSLSINTVNDYVYSLNSDSYKLREVLRPVVDGMKHEVQSTDECLDYITSTLSDGISFSSSPSMKGESTCYNLYSGSREIGTLYLQPNPAKETFFHLIPFQVTAYEFHFDDLYSSVQLTVPSDAQVQVNGKTLGDEFVREDNVPYPVITAYQGFLPAVPALRAYGCDTILGDVDLKVLDASGNDITSISEPMDYLLLKDSGMQARFDDFVDRFIHTYMSYTSGMNRNYYPLSLFIQPRSALANRLISAAEGLTYAHTYSLSYDSIKVDAVYDLGNNYYCCDFTVVITPTGSGNGQTTTTYRILTLDNDTHSDMRVVDLDVV